MASARDNQNDVSNEMKLKLNFGKMPGEVWVTDKVVTDSSTLTIDAEVFWRDDLVLIPSELADGPMPFLTPFVGIPVESKDFAYKVFVTRGVRVNRLTREVFLEYDVLFKSKLTGSTRNKLHRFSLGRIAADMKMKSTVHLTKYQAILQNIFS